MALGTLLILTILGIVTFINLTKTPKAPPEIPVSDPYAGPTLNGELFDWSVMELMDPIKAREKQSATDRAPISATNPYPEATVHSNKEAEIEVLQAVNEAVATDTLQSISQAVSEDQTVIAEVAEDSVHQAVNNVFVPSEFVRAYPTVGYDSLYKYLTEYINKELFGSKNVSDTLRISFAIEVDGHPSGIKLSINTSDSVFMKIEEVVQNMPAWKPATADGQPIVTRFRLPMIIQSKIIKED